MSLQGDEQTHRDLGQVVEILEQRMFEVGDEHPSFIILKDILDLTHRLMSQTE